MCSSISCGISYLGVCVAFAFVLFYYSFSSNSSCDRNSIVPQNLSSLSMAYLMFLLVGLSIHVLQMLFYVFLRLIIL